MSKKDLIEVEGRIVKVLKGWTCWVKLKNGHEVLGTLAGRKRRSNLMGHYKAMPGTKVILKLSPYDLSRGLIVNSSPQNLNR